MYTALPTEILELIVDALDTRSVKALSLVCRGLLLHCRKHLFHTISVPEFRQGCRTTKAFWELLHGTPELCPHIRTIRYVCDNEAPLNVSTMVVAQQITQLQSLHITGVFNSQRTRWTATPHRNALLPLLHLPTVAHLKLNVIDNFFLPDIIPCVGLIDMEIRLVKFDEGPADLPMPLPKPIVIDRFLVGEQDPKSLRLLANARRPDGKPIVDLATFKRLRMQVGPLRTLQDMREFVGKAQHLVEVEMDLSCSDPPWDGLYHMLVGTLETLKRVKIRINASPYGIGSYHYPIPMLCLELEQLRKRNVVESMEIMITACSTSDINRAAKWDILDDTLSKVGWPALKYVSLKIQVTSPWVYKDPTLADALLKLQQMRFARLASTSTIRFEFKVDCWG